MKKSRRILFLFALTLALTAVPARGAPPPITVTGEGAEQLAPLFRTLHLRLASIFRLPVRRAPASLEVALSPAVPAESPEYRVLAPDRRLIVFHNSGEFFSLPVAARRRLYGAILLAQLPNSEGGSPDFLPDWVVLGLDQMLVSREGPERWVRGNRLLPALRGISGLGKAPSFAALPQIAEPADELDPAAAAWCGEMARCRFALMGRSFFNPRDLGDHLRGAFRFPDDFPQPEFMEQAAHLAWNDFYPRPAALSIATFAPLRTVEYPELDQAGKPTGNKLRCELAELGEALREHPDRKEILSRTAAAWNRAARGDSREVRLAAAKLATAILTLPERKRSAPDRQIVNGLREVDELLRRRSELEELLRREAERHTPLSESFRCRFISVRRDPRIASPEIKALLDRTEREYR